METTCESAAPDRLNSGLKILTHWESRALEVYLRALTARFTRAGARGAWDTELKAVDANIFRGGRLDSSL